MGVKSRAQLTFEVVELGDGVRQQGHQPSVVV